MSKVKLTKNELRIQEKQKLQLERYLPTLQLKKALLQSEVFEAKAEMSQYEQEYQSAYSCVSEYSPLLSETISVDPLKIGKVQHIHRRMENIAGIEVPYLDRVEFEPFDYFLVDTPPWLDSLVIGIRRLVEMRIKVKVALEKKQLLEEELRQVSIRVNLFEKILIPRCIANIKKIKVFLGDQFLSTIGQMKIVKKKLSGENPKCVSM